METVITIFTVLGPLATIAVGYFHYKLVKRQSAIEKLSEKIENDVSEIKTSVEYINTQVSQIGNDNISGSIAHNKNVGDISHNVFGGKRGE